MDYDAILQRAREQRQNDPETRSQRQHITPMQEDLRHERPFHRLSSKVQNQTTRELQILSWMASIYQAAGDISGAKYVEDEAFQLAAARTKAWYGETNYDLVTRAIPPAPHALARQEEFNNDSAWGAILSARDLAAQTRQANRQQKPKNTMAYLSKRELGSK
jgi:hypothetical protein